LSGAFDSIHPNRKQVFEEVEQILRQAVAVTEARTSSQNSLFGDAAKAVVTLGVGADWSPMDRLQHEFGAIGFYMSAHPLDAYGASLKRLEVVSYSELAAHLRARGPRAKVAGLLLGKQERTSAKGNRFAFLQLTDQTGMFEATIFSDRLSAAREHLEPGRPLLLSVDIRAEEDTLRLMINSVEPLDTAVANTAAGLRVFIRDEAPITSLRQVLQQHAKGGKGKVELALDLPDKTWEVMMTLPGRYMVSGPVRGAVASIPGIVTVQDT
jgi:DNA polymerase-3 subunit alpha